MSFADLASDAFAAQGGTFVDPSMIMRASVPLELSGEAVRSRICTFLDAQSNEWALRPDLTLPVAKAEVAERLSSERGETLKRYRGRVFRLPALEGEPVEYEQVGIEAFGAPRSVDKDVWLFNTLGQVCAAGGVKTGHVCFGDLSVFPAFVDALDLPEDIGAGLKRAFRQAGGVRAYLADLETKRSGIAGRVSGMSRDEIGTFVEDIFAITGVRPVGERTAEEITERLAQRASTASGYQLSEEQNAVLRGVLDLECALEEAPAALDQLAAGLAGDTLPDLLESFRQRATQLVASSQEYFGSAPFFATRFGRRFTYYDGIVFEVAEDERERTKKRPFLAGGRYDSLLADLSNGAVDVTALGGVVMPHRIPVSSEVSQ